jgi:DNA gyrase subunit B
MEATNNDYDESMIQVLKGLEPVRLRPGMYIGSTDRNGLHHLVWEIFDNSVDEALAGHCSEIRIKLESDGSVSVGDNGRGIPVGLNKDEGVSALTLVFTQLHAGGKFANASGETAYKTSGGLHGVGASVTNALSTWLRVEVRRQGGVYEQDYKQGIVQCEPVRVRDMTPEEKTGTYVRFLPDPEIFEDAIEEGGMHYDFDTIKTRLKQIACLNKQLKIIIEEGERVEEFYSENGLPDMLAENISEGEEQVVDDLVSSKIMTITNKNGEKQEISVDFAINYIKGHQKHLQTFVNNIHTYEGGTHELGLLQAMSTVITSYAQTTLKLNKTFKADDIIEGANIVLSLKLSDAKFVGQTKRKLQSSEARKATYQFAKDLFEDYFEKNPEVAKIVVKKAESAQMARDAAEKSRDQVRRQQVGKAIGGMSGKLADCQSKKPEDCEIYIVEGDSAGGSAKQGRNRKNQAILPLKGKVLNTKKSDLKKMLESKEVLYLMKALGTGIGEDFDITKLRYHKVIIMTDADVDGSHIAVLLLTFFMTQMPELIRAGHIYLAMPPLYSAKRKTGKSKNTRYYLDDEELGLDLEVVEGRGKSWDVGRFKGLGEMEPIQLWDTTMNPETRSLQLVVMDTEHEENAYNVLEKLMGDDVPPRKAFLENNAQYADLDI